VIRTQQKKVPWSWAFYMALMGAFIGFAQHNGGAPLTLVVKKFVERPWLIVMITSMNQVISVLIAPYTSWKSDRIWTRWGRRKPLMFIGLSLSALGLAIVPFAPNIWVLVLAVVIWLASYDFGYMGIWTPLCYEVVPSPQRGRFQVIRRYIGFPINLAFTYFMLKQFENNYNLPVGKWIRIGQWTPLGDLALHFTGAHVTFLGGVVSLIIVITLLLPRLQEVRPDKPMPEKKFSLGVYFLSLFGNHQWRMIYSLIFCVACMTAGLSSLGVLLIKEQFGYNMKQLAIMSTIQSILDLAIILPVSAFIVDRYNRFRIFQIGLLLSTVHPISYWLFVKYLVPGHIPGIPWIIGFGMFNAVVDGTAVIALEPLIYDLIPRRFMGTVNSGFLLIRHLLGIFIANGVGIWVSVHAWLFLPKDAAGKQTYDYMSGFLYVFGLGVAGCVVCWYFGRQLKSGRIVQYGKLEDEGHPVDIDAPGAAGTKGPEPGQGPAQGAAPPPP